MSRPAPKMECRECGCDLGYGFAKAPICTDCGQLSLLPTSCTCAKDERGRVATWDERCPFHAHDPYDIPY